MCIKPPISLMLPICRRTTELAFFTPAARKLRRPGCFLPFSAGPKGCPAAGFALHEMRLLLVRVLQRFELAQEPTGGGAKSANLILSSRHR